jgi:hypothetical protein
VVLGLWWTCGTGAVVDLWHWDGGGLIVLGLWWTCSTGTVVDMWHWDCGGSVTDTV